MSNRRERWLLALAGAFVLAGAAALSLAPFARADSWSALPDAAVPGPWLIPLVWTLSAGAATWAAGRARPGRDPLLLPLIYWLAGWGLVLIWRLSPAFGLRQSAWLAVSTAGLVGLLLAPGDLRWLRRYRYTWLAAGLALAALTFLVGVNPEGSGPALWLSVRGFFLQPTELLKVLLVVFLAAYLADRRDVLFDLRPDAAAARLPYALPLLAGWGFSMLVVMAQRDLGMGMLYFAAFVVMVYLASGQAIYLAVGGLLLLLGSAAGYALFDVVRLRVEGWLDPWADPSGHSYQIVQSLIALAAGGLFGRGPGQGFPALVPVAHSDFIAASLAEEWGLAGLLGLLALWAALIARGLRTAIRARGSFEQLLAGGLASLLGLQALLIIGGVFRALPLTGVTLPFVSYGGTSLLVSFLAAGVLVKLSGDP